MRKSRKLRLFVITAVMVLSTAVLGLPNNKVACAFAFCDTCCGDCSRESLQIYNQCIDGGGTRAECRQQDYEYYYRCTQLFCPTCNCRF